MQVLFMYRELQKIARMRRAFMFCKLRRRWRRAQPARKEDYFLGFGKPNVMNSHSRRPL